MKYKISYVGALVIVLLFSSTFFLATSCNKSAPSDVTISVVDALGAPVANAKVKLSAPSAPNKKLASYLPDTKTTGSDGKSFHTFPLEAVLIAEVSKDSLLVTDVVRLKKDEGISQTIILK